MIIKRDIHEYDIKQCDANVMYDYGLIDKAKHTELLAMDKKKRVITVGIMRKDSNLDKSYHDAIRDSVELFKSTNMLDDKDVYEVAKDAVWVHRRVLHTSYKNNIEFVLKNTATIMYVFKNIKFYYNNDDGNFFTRGLGGKTNKMCDVVKTALIYYSSKSNSKLYRFLHEIKTNYIIGTLDESYYVPIHGDDTALNIKLLDDLISSLL